MNNTYEQVILPLAKEPWKSTTSCVASSALPLAGDGLFHVSTAEIMLEARSLLQPTTSAEN